MRIIPVEKTVCKSCRGDGRSHYMGRISFPSTSCPVCYGRGYEINDIDRQPEKVFISENKKR